MACLNSDSSRRYLWSCFLYKFFLWSCTCPNWHGYLCGIFGQRTDCKIPLAVVIPFISQLFYILNRNHLAVHLNNWPVNSVWVSSAALYIRTSAFEIENLCCWSIDFTFEIHVFMFSLKATSKHSKESNPFSLGLKSFRHSALSNARWSKQTEVHSVKMLVHHLFVDSFMIKRDILLVHL